MKQQFLPRSLRLRLGLVEAASGSRDAQAPAGCSAPQFSAMAVLDIHMEAASVADYLRKHNLTETLAVFLKEAKLAVRYDGIPRSSFLPAAACECGFSQSLAVSGSLSKLASSNLTPLLCDAGTAE